LTGLVIRAFVISQTFNRLAANFVISRVAEEAISASAYSLVILRSAFRIPSTKYEIIAHMLTFWEAVSILSTDFIRTTVSVCLAFGDRLTNTILTALEGRAIRVGFASSEARVVKADLIVEAVPVGGTHWCTNSIGAL